MLALALDGLIVVLLLAALGLGVRLHFGLRSLRQNGGEFERLVNALDAATGRAESALGGLKGAADEVGKRWHEEVATVQRVLDDLRFLTGRGEQLADQLETQIRQARTSAAEVTARHDLSPATPATGPAPQAAADLEQALRALR
jgi:hypothetical protein